MENGFDWLNGSWARIEPCFSLAFFFFLFSLFLSVRSFFLLFFHSPSRAGKSLSCRGTRSVSGRCAWMGRNNWQKGGGRCRLGEPRHHRRIFCSKRGKSWFGWQVGREGLGRVRNKFEWLLCGSNTLPPFPGGAHQRAWTGKREKQWRTRSRKHQHEVRSGGVEVVWRDGWLSEWGHECGRKGWEEPISWEGWRERGGGKNK